MNLTIRERCSLKAALAVVATAALLVGCQNDAAAPVAAPASPVVRGMAWTAQGDNWAQDKATLQALGEQFDTSWSMYEKLKADAGGGTKLTWDQLALPSYDWWGIYTRTKGGLHFDPDLKPNEGPVSAQLTPEGQQVVAAKLAHIQSTGGEYDPISDCRPPGTPRWFTEPFLHEFVVTPDQAWLTNEMVNDTRRVYTDGRPHTDDADAYPTWNGDTVGFWDGDILVTHTKDLMAGQYQRGVQPNYSEQVTTVERWRKVDPRTLQADVWVFDPVNLAKPWYTRQSWTKLTNDDYLLRIRYWDCRENSNNAIVVTDEGTSQFPDFDFVEDDAAVSSDDAVKKAAEGAVR
jgi:hypothetical protein